MGPTHCASSGARITLSPADQHLAVGEQRRGEVVAGGMHAACGRPFARGRIIHIRAGDCEEISILLPARD